MKIQSRKQRLFIWFAICLILFGLLGCLLPYILQNQQIEADGITMDESLKELKLSPVAETAIATDAPDPSFLPSISTPALYILDTVDRQSTVNNDSIADSTNPPKNSGIRYPKYSKNVDVIIPVNDPAAYNTWLIESMKTPTPSPVPTATPSPTATPAPTPVTGKTGADLAACRKRNKDFIAWIQIPGTSIDYPIVATNNTDYYLNHTFDGKKSSLGTLFSLGKSSWKAPSRNIAIYGHNVSGSGNRMFSGLHKYKQESYFKTHPVIYLDSWYRPGTYRIFAAFDITVGDWDPSTTTFASNNEFLSFVERAKSLTPYDTGVTVKSGDTIISLITCDKDFKRKVGRFIVMAVRQ